MIYLDVENADPYIQNLGNRILRDGIENILLYKLSSSYRSREKLTFLPIDIANNPDDKVEILNNYKLTIILYINSLVPELLEKTRYAYESVYPEIVFNKDIKNNFSTEEFYGKTLEERLDNRISLLETQLDNSPGEERRLINNELTSLDKSLLVFTSVLIYSELNRIDKQYLERTFKDNDIEMAFWRLSPFHKWYGGNEICEVYANNTGNGARGLYYVSELPARPHPNCACYLEPSFI